jgi:methylmalonyl-CoA mutase cobalamin-binding subunit/DNA-binding phage protein
MTKQHLPIAVMLRRHSIADVERDTGISKDTLRVWERRYGFPDPARDDIGERWYTDDQLGRLRQVRRLLDRGWRPNKVVPLGMDELLALLEAPVPKAKPSAQARNAPAPCEHPLVADWMHWVVECDAASLRQAMERALLTDGLAYLLREVLPPMTRAVGMGWINGELGIHQEHLYTETVQAVLRQAIAQVRQNRMAQSPRVLLTTIPDEHHGLGLLMAEALMALDACDTVSLGLQMPLPDIVTAARDFRVDMVGLSFGGAQNPRDVKRAVAWLRERLAPDTVVWLGGRLPRGLADEPASAGLCPLWVSADADDMLRKVAQWRTAVQH